MSKDLRLFFTYLGGKYRAVPHYPEPRYDTIIEPFAGSAGYAVRYPDREVVLIEKDDKIAAVWRYLLNTSADDIAALPLIGEGWATTDDLTHLPDGARYLIGLWLSKATTSPRKTPSRWALTRPDASYWGPRVRERIAQQVSRIEHWTIIHGDYTEAPDVVATWFIDPPYVVGGHQYPHGSSGIDYAALAKWCQSRPGQAIVCEGEGATWLPFERLAEIKGQRRQFNEAIWTSDGVEGEVAA